MKIINRTKYRTADLRVWLVAAHKAMEAPHEQKTVEIVYGHAGGHWGRGAYSGYSMKLTLPGDPSKIRYEYLAHVTEHEIGHNLGLKHGDMDEDLMWGRGRVPSWEVGLQLRLRAEEAAIPMTDRVASRAAHAQKMLDRWDRKIRLAKTIRSKWAAKVRYYDRKNAASPPKGGV